MNWKNYIIIGISLGIGFLLGFIVGWRPAFEGILNYVVSGLSIGVLLGITGLAIRMVGIIWGWYETKEKKKLAHSEVLLNNLKLMAETDVGFDGDDKYNLNLQIINIPTTLEYKMYIKNVDAHLKSGYKEVWELIENRESLIDKHNIEARKFLNNLNKKIISDIKQIIPDITEWDSYSQLPVNYYTEHLLQEVAWNLRFCYTKKCNFNPQFNSETPSEGTTTWKLTISNTLVRGDNKDKIQKVREIIVGAFIAVVHGEDFEILKKSFKNIKDEHDLIVRKAYDIVKDVESGTPLEGKCEIAICRGNRTWQTIK